MRIGTWARLLLAAAPLLAGCGNFWQAPGGGSTSFTLGNSGNISISPGAATGNTSTITVTPSNSFSGTVALSCAITSSPSNATSPTTCSLSSSSLTISGSAAQTTTLTASTTSTTTLGDYTITVTGVSGSTTENTAVCVDVTTTSGSCSSTATTSGNFYILTGSSIAGYSVGSGSLNAISGGAFTFSGATASAIAIGPNGNFLYVATTSGIVVYTIDTSTGALTQGSVIYADPLAEAIQVDPSGKWLLDASAGGELNAIPITSAGIEDTSRSVYSPSLTSNLVQPGGLAISPNGGLIAVALGTTGVELFPFTSGNTTSSPIGSPYSNVLKPYRSGGAAVAVAMDPQSRLLYVGETAAFSSNTNSGALRVYTIGSNSVSELNYKTPYAPAGLGPHAILPDSSGDYVYVASWQTGSAGVITGYSVATSALTALSATVATGTEPVGLAEDSNNSFVLAISFEGSPYFDAYTFASAGQLNTSLTASTASNPIAIVATP
jgi:hypothetical protein